MILSAMIRTAPALVAIRRHQRQKKLGRDDVPRTGFVQVVASAVLCAIRSSMTRRAPRLVATIRGLRLHRVAAARAEADAIRKSGLFDEDYYSSLYPDVAADNIEPLQHFIKYGASEARQPHPLFDTAYYLETYPEVRQAKINPILHYLRVGAAEELNPSPLFITKVYLDFNPEAFDCGITPLEHYLDTERTSLKVAHPLFNSSFYLLRNRDVAEQRVNPLVHYLRQGAAEGRDPNPWFNSRFYLEQYPDVQTTGVNPLAHYVRWGAAQCLTPSPMFDPNFYMDENPTVAALGMNPLHHFLHNGFKHGLAPYRPVPDFAEFESRQEPGWRRGEPKVPIVLSDESDSAAGTDMAAPRTSAAESPGTEQTGETNRTHLPDNLYATMRTPPNSKENSMKKKPRLVFTSPSWKVSDIHCFTVTLMQGLAERGCEVELLLTSAGVGADDLPDVPYRFLDNVMPGSGRPVSAERWSRVMRYFVDQAPCIFVPGNDFVASAVSAALPYDVGILGIIHGDDREQYEHATRLGRFWNAIVAVSECCYNRTVAINRSFKPITHHIPYGVELLESTSQTIPEKIASPFSNARMTDAYVDVIREIWREITLGLYRRPSIPRPISEIGPILPPPWLERDPATFA